MDGHEIQNGNLKGIVVYMNCKQSDGLRIFLPVLNDNKNDV